MNTAQEYYRISENMTAWEIAHELLNRSAYIAYDEYGYLFYAIRVHLPIQTIFRIIFI